MHAVDVPATRDAKTGGLSIADRVVGDRPARAAAMKDRQWVELLDAHAHVRTPASFEFDDRGAHVLEGVPGEWHVLAVRG
jgi:hypothetical protein